MNIRKWCALILTAALCLGIGSVIPTAAEAVVGSLYAVISPDAVGTATDPERNSTWIRLCDGYLFLPSCTDLSKLPLYFEGGGEMKITSKTGKSATFKSGDAVNIATLFSGTRITDCKYPVTLSSGASTLSVTIMKSENLPSIYISTESGSINYVNSTKGNQEGGTLCFLEADGSVTYNGKLKKIKGRGNASWGGGATNKRPYNITLSDKAELVPGAGAGKKWCLLNSSADRQDETYFANQMAMETAFRIKGAFSPLATEMVEFYCDGDYRGLYEITEKIDFGTSLIPYPDQEDFTADGPNGAQVVVNDPYDSAIANGIKTYTYWSSAAYQEPDPDITGGYIVEGDGYYRNEKCYFVTKRGAGFTVKRPEYATREQVAYIASYVQDYENALFSSTGYNDKGKHYTDYADLDSLAARFVVENFFYCKEQLGNSTYITKPAGNDSKLYFGPMWDYENVMSSYAWIRNGSTTQYNPVDTLIVPTGVGNTLLTKGDFMERFYDINRESFMPMVSAYLGTANFENNGISLTDMVKKYEASVRMDIIRTKKEDIWDAEVAKMTTWLSQRIDYWTGSNGIRGVFDPSYLRGATAHVGQNGTLNVELRGTATGYQWYKMTEDLRASSAVPGATGQTFTPEESGTYYAIVKGQSTSGGQNYVSSQMTTNPVVFVK